MVYASLADIPKARYNRYVYEALLYLVEATATMVRISINPFLPQLITEFNISYAEAGALSSATMLTQIFVPVVSGILVSRFSAAKTFFAGGILSAVSGIISCFAPNYAVLFASRFLTGVGIAFIFPPLVVIVMRIFPRKEIGLINGVNNTCGALGTTLALNLAPVLAGLGWRTIIFGYSLVTLLVAVAWLLIGRTLPTEPARQDSKKSERRSSIGDVLRMKETWLLTFTGMGGGSAYMIAQTWLPTYYQDAGYSLAVASAITSIMSLVSIFSSVISGVASDRIGLRKPFIWIPGIVNGFVFLGMIFLEGPLLIANSVLLGFTNFVWGPMLTTITMEVSRDAEMAGLIMGVRSSVSSIGSSAAPTAVGIVRDTTGSLQTGLLLMFMGEFVGVCGILLRETGRGRTSQKK